MIRPIVRKAFDEFIKHESSSGILLLMSTAIAMLLANSDIAAEFDHLLHIPLTLGWGNTGLTMSLTHWVNDGLMAIFFFLVGLEIKREILVGELQSLQKAALPIGAALGGMVFPALIYLALNFDSPGAAGWGIPMATDIAFALGILSLAGSDKAPKGLSVFLAALAIADDLGAILVIAIFYTAKISWLSLGLAFLVLLVLVAVNKFKITSPFVYIPLGLLLWFATLKSGIHATIAGVLLGMTIPNDTSEDSESLLEKFEHTLTPWVSYLIMPIFALANAGVHIDTSTISAAVMHPVSLGIIGGLFIGKQLGIFGAAWILVRTKIGRLPDRTTFHHLHAASLLGGVGFTMSMFIATLAFKDANLLALSKIGIITASILAALSGLLRLNFSKQPVLEQE